jgi:hypothetical protein
MMTKIVDNIMPGLGGSPTVDEMMYFDGQDVTQCKLYVFLEHVAVCWDYLAHVAG